MTVPTVQAFINFSTGPSTAQAMILDTGVLDTNILADAASVIVDVSNLINQITIKRGRNPQADQFQTGTMSLRLIDTNGDYNPLNTSGPYYGLLNPMIKVSIQATSLGVVYPLGSFFVTAFNNISPNNALSSVKYTIIEGVDAMRLAQMAQITTVAGSSTGDLSSTRVSQILDQISWPTSMRSIETGLTTVQANPNTAATALNAAQACELVEFGAFYVDASGNFVFKNRTTTSTSVAGTPYVFKDDGTNLPYFDATWLLNDSLVYNSASVTRIGGTAQTDSNAASITKYFTHSYNQINTMFSSDADALNYTQAYVASRAETTTRCDLLVLDFYYPNAAMVLAGLKMDYFQPVTISTTQPGGSVLVKTLQVFGVAWAISPNSFKATYTTLEPILDSFILDSTLYGILDTSVLSY